MKHRTLRLVTAAVALCATVEAVAQRRRPSPPTPPPPAAPQIPPESTFDPNEVISVAVTQAEGMLRRMRVFLFIAPPNDDSYGVGRFGPGRRIWALLPSCREHNDVDNRDPCPVERIVIEASVAVVASARGPRTKRSCGNSESQRFA